MKHIKKYTYFASDFHLGFRGAKISNQEREGLIVEWLCSIRASTKELYLVGDIFDFWYEYAMVIPKGHSAFLAEIKEFRKEGIPIYFFTGNHDLWMKDYFTAEFDIPIIRQAITKEIDGKIFHMAHGDGLGPGDRKYKLMKKVFTNPICQWLFSRVHPNVAIRLMRYFSQRSREKDIEVLHFLGEDKEWLVQYCKSFLADHHADFMILGHRHIPIDFKFKDSESRYINLGEWLSQRSYARFDGQNLELLFYKNENGKIYP